jgi:hypothetical protein
MTQLRIAKEIVTNRFRRIDFNRLWHVLAADFTRNLVVIVKVDAGRLMVLLRKEALFQALVGRHIPMKAAGVGADGIGHATGRRKGRRGSAIGARIVSCLDIPTRRRSIAIDGGSIVLITAATIVTATISSTTTATKGGRRREIAGIRRALVRSGSIVGCIVACIRSTTALSLPQMRWHIFTTCCNC